jgi:flagellar L-ring protein FlgH
VRKLAIVLCFVFALPACAKDKVNQADGKVQSESLAQYLARMQPGSGTAEARSVGSLWVDDGRFANISSDYKAMHVGDLITIAVVQGTTANNAGSVSTARNFSASSGIAALPGQLKTAGVANLFSPNSAAALTGKGQAATTSTLTTTISGRVVAVLPGGTLVVEAERKLTMNNEKQTVLLRGMVRPADIGTNNTVASNAIANLELELKGKGVISEGNRQPNVIMRAILRVLNF